MAKFKLTAKNIRPKQAELVLVHPVFGETDSIVYLVGTMSKQFKDAQLKARKSVGPDIDIAALDYETQMKLLGSVCADCIVGWNSELAEAIGEYSPEAAVRLFEDQELSWIGEQVSASIHTTANFFRPEPTSMGQVGSEAN
jgi:hypothetical protein